MVKALFWPQACCATNPKKRETQSWHAFNYHGWGSKALIFVAQAFQQKIVKTQQANSIGGWPIKRIKTC